jgi:hypothetical protein
MSHPSRRTFLGSAVVTATSLASTTHDALAAPDPVLSKAPTPQSTTVKGSGPPPPQPVITKSPPPPPPPPGPPLGPNGKYRSAQRYLFQTVPASVIPRRIPTGRDYPWDNFGPTQLYVDFHSAWSWTRVGGDWIDANGVRHGNRPWFAIASDKTLGATAVASYNGDVSLAVKHAQAADRWCAFLLVAENAPRSIAGPASTRHAAPFIDVVYANGSTARLACRIVAANTSSSTGPYTTAEQFSLPAFVEFERPVPLATSAVVSAQISYVLTEHWSGNSPAVAGYLLDPPVNQETSRAGLAAATGALDAGIEAQAGVIGAHRYLDGVPWDDFRYLGESTFSSERNYDPAIFDNGPTNLNTYPHVGLGKWINAGPQWSLVQSNYINEGFKPLAPGLGAVRVPMPAEVFSDGANVGYGGTLAGNAMIFLPEPMFGRLGRIFVRYYFRLGSDATGAYNATAAKRFHVYNSPGISDWTTMAGKWGIAPDHSSATGGVSGSSGGGNGWQMRNSWYDCDASTGGPSDGGWTTGFHLHDFQYQNPTGHNYGREQAPTFERWGQRGGTGGVLYANQWYCVETELKLNSVANTTPGFTPDGELRAWIDGRLVFERTGMVFRTLPMVPVPYNPNQIRACRELGVRGLWLNWFHGGKTLSSMDRTSFYTGLVWSQQYIGPMNGAVG